MDTSTNNNGSLILNATTTNLEQNNDDDAVPIPDYVCCVVTESVWIWFGAVVLTLILMLMVTLKYCKKKFSKPRFLEKNRSLLLRHVMEDDKSAYKSVREEPVHMDDFPGYFEKRRRLKTIDQMETVKVFQSNAKNRPAIIAARREHPVRRRNNDADSVPFDYNRVIMKCDNAGDDYINASYITGTSGRWIVSQSPMENTIGDFWRLIWQERTPVVVMLTRSYELIKVMSAQYWPLFVGKKEQFGGGEFEVTLTAEETYAHYRVRKMTVVKMNEPSSPPRKIVQYQYTNWLSFNFPSPNSLLTFRRRVMEEINRMRQQLHNDDEEMGRPPLVHCINGGIRSGTYIALEENMTLMEKKKCVDVFGAVSSLQAQRRSLFATNDQLRYIYDVIVDRVLCGDTYIAIKEILPKLQAKSKKDPMTKINEYVREHRLLNQLIPRFTIGDCAAGHRAENRSKNRNVLIVPPDASRPYLTSFQSNDSTDYINAVMVDGYRMADEFICTEWPMQHTLANFWSMIYDHDIKTVVVLNHPKASGQFPQFWPGDIPSKKRNYGPVFCVEEDHSEELEGGRYCRREFKVTKQDVAPHNMKPAAKELQLFQILCWPSNQKVPNSTLALVHLIDAVEKWRGNKSESVPKDKVVVVSADGYSRCGIYCVTASCLEQAYRRQEVDVFQSVKTVRQNRTQLVANRMEYKYCYDVVLHYVLNHLRPQ